MAEVVTSLVEFDRFVSACNGLPVGACSFVYGGERVVGVELHASTVRPDDSELRDEQVAGFWDADMRRVAEWVTR